MAPVIKRNQFKFILAHDVRSTSNSFASPFPFPSLLLNLPFSSQSFLVLLSLLVMPSEPHIQKSASCETICISWVFIHSLAHCANTMAWAFGRQYCSGKSVSWWWMAVKPLWLLMLHCRLNNEGGHKSGSGEQRIKLLGRMAGLLPTWPLVDTERTQQQVSRNRNDSVQRGY